MIDFNKEVLQRLYMLHANTYGDSLIKKNVGLSEDVDTVEWCKKQLKMGHLQVSLCGKNWHVCNKKYRFIINIHTLIIVSVKRL